MGWGVDFFEVDLNKVESPNFDTTWQGSKGYPREQIERWAHQLGRIQSLSQDRGLQYEDFVRLRSSLNPIERALGETHHHFYDHAGNSHLKLAWTGDRYTIDNGQHRIHAAKQLGLSRAPAEISAPEQEIGRCRAEGFRTPLLAPADRGPEVKRVLSSNVSSGARTSPGASDKPIWERENAERTVRKDRLDR